MRKQNKPMLYDILYFDIPQPKKIKWIDPVAYKPSLKFVPQEYDASLTYGNTMTDYENALWMICDVFERTGEKPLYLEKYWYDARDLFRHIRNALNTADNIFQQHQDEGNLVKHVKLQVLGERKQSEDLGCFDVTVYEDEIRRIHKDLDFVISNLAYYGLYDMTFRIIQEYYDTRCEEKNNMWQKKHFPLDYPWLYTPIGDICLLRHFNVPKASSFYRLAALDWEFGVSDKYKENKVVSWDSEDYCRFYLATSVMNTWYVGQDIYVNKYIIDLRYCINNAQMSEIFSDFMMAALEYNIDRSLEIYNKIDKKIDELNQTSVELRIIIAKLLMIRAGSLIDVMDRLKDDKDSRKHQNAVFRTLTCSAMAQQELPLVWEYVNKNVFSCMDWVRAIKTDFSTYYDEYKVILNLAKVQKLINNTKQALKVGVEMDTRLAYYTSYEVIKSMIVNEENTGGLFMFHVAYMNDPNEGQVLLKHIFGNKRKNDGIRNNSKMPYIFIKCFTSLIDDLPMWEMYGDKAKGVCIVLNGRFFERIDEDNVNLVYYELPLYHVCYFRKSKNKDAFSITVSDNVTIPKDKLNEVKNNLNKIKKIINTDMKHQEWYISELEELRYLFKISDYAHEQETRLLYNNLAATEILQTTNDDMIFYKMEALPEIEEIILGPKFEEKQKTSIYLQYNGDRLYGRLNMNNPRITYSSIEYQ